MSLYTDQLSKEQLCKEYEELQAKANLTLQQIKSIDSNFEQIAKMRDCAES